MLRFLESVLFFLFGAGLLLVAWRAWKNGEIPAGSNFFKGRYAPSYKDNPLMFTLFLFIYAVGGILLLVCALALLTGRMPPLKLM
ncbi:hypothetical protein AQUSIP_10400 [Aquicella siphonis]|uniref:Uncharacterized protein n=1 Tax=Aquicella siphonis TaxID=254247 RepID=A0A5E4PHE9_9COXI|nr:hypothetical protein [Aquicella siphonis]VVC75746.1 hypothetical protein AQUSIP_10400 [Aquicella siphonis]